MDLDLDVEDEGEGLVLVVFIMAAKLGRATSLGRAGRFCLGLSTWLEVLLFAAEAGLREVRVEEGADGGLDEGLDEGFGFGELPAMRFQFDEWGECCLFCEKRDAS